MTNTKHTPGPWLDLGNTQVGYIYPQPSRKGPVIVANTYVNKPTFMSVEEAKANARLIASAPDLLAFAQLVSDFFDKDSAGHAQYLKEQADNVLAKAVGAHREPSKETTKKSNALIAAAPDLLACLERVTYQLKHEFPSDEAWQDARKAIARATGQD